MADTLTVRYGPAWTPTDDTELIAAVAERLTPHGGTYLLPPYFADVEDARRMLEHGQLCEHPVTVIAGAPNRCHDNAARYADEHDAELWCGYALGNDMWRPHSWCVDGERIIETTVEADAYYGAIDPAT